MKLIFTFLGLTVIVILSSCRNNSNVTTETASDKESVTAKVAGEINHYVCFTENDIKDLEMSVSFDIYDNALKVKYKGQNKDLLLHYIDEVIITPGQPETKTLYNEILEREVTGSYEFIHSGNWYYALYKRKSDGQEFNFTIDHNQSVVNGVFRKTPCY